MRPDPQMILAIRREIVAYHFAISDDVKKEVDRLEALDKAIREKHATLQTLQEAEKIKEDAEIKAKGLLAKCEEKQALLDSKETTLNALAGTLAQREHETQDKEDQADRRLRNVATKEAEAQAAIDEANAQLARDRQELEVFQQQNNNRTAELNAQEKRINAKLDAVRALV